jgi:Fic family protein
VKFLAQKDAESTIDMPSAMKEVAFMVHKFMFNGILSNASKRRKAFDPGGGQIHLRGIKHQQQKSEFQETFPPNIDAELDKAFDHLFVNSDHPIKQVMRFYQHFVYIHPFYDGNDRIGWVIVLTYL